MFQRRKYNLVYEITNLKENQFFTAVEFCDERLNIRSFGCYSICENKHEVLKLSLAATDILFS